MRNIGFTILATILALLFQIAASCAADPERLAIACMSCHGADGIGRGSIPPLAGRSAAELDEAMKAFASGTRKGTVMNFLAKGYNADQIAELAAYFSTRKTP